MAETSSGENSLSKILRSPLRSNSPKSKSSSTNPLSRFNPAKLFSRKNSSVGKGGSQSGRGTSSPEEVESGEMNPSTLLDSAKDLVQVAKDVIDEKTSQTLPQIKDEVNITAKAIESSTEATEKKFSNYFDKAMDGLEKTMEDLKGKAKGGVEKAKEGVEKAKEVLDREIHGKSKDINEKTPISEVKAPNIAGRVKEEVVAIVDTLQSFSKQDETSIVIEGEIKKVEKKEDDCVTSLAQGLQKVCAPWSIKKED